MSLSEDFVGDIQAIIGTPQNFAGEVILYSIAGALLIGVVMMFMVFGFRVMNRWV